MASEFYFAYGMNTNITEMAHRCPNAQLVGTARLPFYSLVMSTHADIRPDSNGEVYGAVWYITPECLNALDSLEGYPVYYDRHYEWVIHNNQQLKVLTYTMVGSPELCPPGNYYYEMVREGYQQTGLPVEQLDRSVAESARVLHYHN